MLSLLQNHLFYRRDEIFRPKTKINQKEYALKTYPPNNLGVATKLSKLNPKRDDILTETSGRNCYNMGEYYQSGKDDAVC